MLRGLGLADLRCAMGCLAVRKRTHRLGQQLVPPLQTTIPLGLNDLSFEIEAFLANYFAALRRRAPKSLRQFLRLRWLQELTGDRDANRQPGMAPVPDCVIVSCLHALTTVGAHFNATIQVV